MTVYEIEMTTKGNDFNEEELQHDVADALRAAIDAPVFIKRAAKPTHALVSIGEYDRLVLQSCDLIEAMSKPDGVADLEIEYDRSLDVPRAAEFED